MLTRYEPWHLLTRWQHELDRLFDETPVSARAAASGNTHALLPNVDVSEDAERYLVRADLPGVEQKDIEITTDKGVLTLGGVRRYENRGEARFQRRFTLPENALADQIKARHTNGVLELSIPKQPKMEPRRITVEAA